MFQRWGILWQSIFINGWDIDIKKTQTGSIPSMNSLFNTSCVRELGFSVRDENVIILEGSSWAVRSLIYLTGPPRTYFTAIFPRPSIGNRGDVNFHPLGSFLHSSAYSSLLPMVRHVVKLSFNIILSQSISSDTDHVTGQRASSFQSNFLFRFVKIAF